MIFKKNNLQPSKKRYSPDFIFEGKQGEFFYTYIRKNASTSFKMLFQTLHPNVCSDDIPTISCMMKHAQVIDLQPEEIDQRFPFKVYIYRDPIDRVFSAYKNKLVQQDGAVDLLRRLENVVKRDPGLLTFDEFVHEYVVLLDSERWEEVDVHLYPQVWHLLPITYNKVIRMDNVYKEMQDLLSIEICDKIFKEPSNSTSKGSVPLPWADSDCPAVYFRKKYAQDKALPTLAQLLTPATEIRLREIYAEDYQMIAEVEGQSLGSLPANVLGFNFPTVLSEENLEKALGLDFSLPEDRY